MLLTKTTNMKKFLPAIAAFFCAYGSLSAQSVPLSQSLNNIPTASSLNNNEPMIVIQGGVGRKASAALMGGYIAALLDGDLQAFGALTGTNTIYYRSANNTWSPVNIGSNLTFSGGTLSATGGGGGGTWGTITGTLSNQTDLQSALNAKQNSDGDLDALAALAGVNTIYYRSAASVWSAVTIGSNLTFSGGTLSATGGGGGGTGTVTATSGSLGPNQIILGNSGVDIKQLGSLGTSSTVLHGNAAGAPFFGAVSLTNDVSGTLSRVTGGLGADTSAYGTGLIGSDGSSNTVDVDTISELTTALSLTGTAGGSTFLAGDGSWKTVTASAPGANSQVLFNDGGILGADVDFSWDKTANVLTVPTMAVTTLNTNSFKVMDSVNQSHGLSFRALSDLTADQTFDVAGAFNFAMTLTGNTAVTFPTTGTLATTANLAAFDTDSDGKVNVLDIGAGVVKTDASGVVGLADAQLLTVPTVGGDSAVNDAYTVTVSPAPASTTNAIITFRANTDNTGPATLNVNGLGALPIYKPSGSPITTSNELADQDIKAFQYVTVVGTGSSYKMLSQLGNAATGGGGGTGTKTIAVFKPENNNPPASNFATLDTRNSISVIDFDDTTQESATFVGIVPEAAVLTSGLIVRIQWMATTATTGNARWGVQIERMNTDLDTDSFDTAAEATTATNGTSGIITVTAITTATIDSIAVGEPYRVTIYRDVTDAADTVSGDLEVVAVEVRTAN